jgi:Fur family zinc uptake transcriptional regulator
MSKCKNHKICLNDIENTIEKTCLERNLKFTDLRRKVFFIMSKSHRMIKAYDILAQMRKNNPSIEPPTVYRALDFLIENNFIHKINSFNSYITCYNFVSEKFCFFLICSKCGSVEENLDSRFSNLILSSVRKHKLFLQKSSLEIEGICNNCS